MVFRPGPKSPSATGVRVGPLTLRIVFLIAVCGLFFFLTMVFSDSDIHFPPVSGLTSKLDVSDIQFEIRRAASPGSSFPPMFSTFFQIRHPISSRNRTSNIGSFPNKKGRKKG